MVKNLIKILFFIVLTSQAFGQIKPYKIPGDTAQYYIMDQKTRDLIFEIMVSNETNEGLVKSQEKELSIAYDRIHDFQKQDSLRAVADTIRQQEIRNLKPKTFQVQGLRLDASWEYMASNLTPSYEIGTSLRISLFGDFLEVNPGFNSRIYTNEEKKLKLDFGLKLNASIKIY